jgi:hypothetical protein
VVAVEVSQLLAFSVRALDPDPGDYVAFQQPGLPSGASFLLPAPGNPAIATFSWRPKRSDVGSRSLAFVATDSKGLFAVCPVDIRVVEESHDLRLNTVSGPATVGIGAQTYGAVLKNRGPADEVATAGFVVLRRTGCGEAIIDLFADGTADQYSRDINGDGILDTVATRWVSLSAGETSKLTAAVTFPTCEGGSPESFTLIADICHGSEGSQPLFGTIPCAAWDDYGYDTYPENDVPVTQQIATGR